MATSRPASTSGYASTIHNWPAALGRKFLEISGSAKLSTVLSIEMSRTGSINTASPAHWREPAFTVTSSTITG